MFELAKCNQEAAKKLLQLPGKDHTSIIKVLTRVDKERTDKNMTPIITRLIDDFVSASKENKNFSVGALSVYASKIDEFFTKDYFNKDIYINLILGTICSNYFNGIQSPNVDLKTFLSYINKNNIRLCDYLVKQYPEKPEVLQLPLFFVLNLLFS